MSVYIYGKLKQKGNGNSSNAYATVFLHGGRRADVLS
jgi:hypothetical protein